MDEFLKLDDLVSESVSWSLGTIDHISLWNDSWIR